MGAAALIWSISSCCSPGRSISLRAAASPLCPRLSPRARTIWSAPFAAVHRLGEARVGAALALGRVLRRVLVLDRAALHEGGVVRVLGLDAVEHRHRVVVLALAPPGPEHVVLVVAQRADHDRRLGGVERERRAVVLEQDHRLAGRLTRLGAVVGGHEAGRIDGLGLVDVGVLEEPGAELHPQDPPHRVVEARHRDPVLGQQLLAEVADVRAHHLGVGARVERGLRRIRAVGRDAVAAGALVGVLRRARAQLGDGGVVALDEAVEAPLALEDVRLGLGVGASGDAADGVERAHHGVGARVDRGLERRQVEVAQPLLGHVGRVVLTAALGLAVRREVLDAGDDLVGRRVVAALRRLDARGGEDGAEIGVLAGGLGDAAPARLVGDVDHRAVDLLDADGRRLAGADGVVGGGHRRVEAARRAQRDREDRAVAVDRVVGEEDRDVQPRLLDRDVLEVVDLRRIDEAEDRADALLRVRVGDLPVGEQLDLLQLLVGGHLAQQVVDPALDAAVGGLSRRLQRGLVRRPRRRHHGACDQHAQYDDRRDDRGSTSPRSHVTLPPDVPPAGPAAPRNRYPRVGGANLPRRAAMASSTAACIAASGGARSRSASSPKCTPPS